MNAVGISRTDNLINTYTYHAPVESLHPTKELLVIAAIDEDLSVVLDRLRQYGEGSSLEFLFLSLSQLLRAHFRFRLVRRHLEVVVEVSYV